MSTIRMFLLTFFIWLFGHYVHASSEQPAPITLINKSDWSSFVVNDKAAKLSGHVAESKNILSDPNIAQYSIEFDETYKLLLQTEYDRQYEVALPMPNGDFIILVIAPSYIMSPALGQKYSSIRTFEALPANGENRNASIIVSPNGLYAQYEINGERYYIDSVSSDKPDQMTVYKTEALQRSSHSIRERSTQSFAPSLSVTPDQGNELLAALEEPRLYRLAMSASAEYTKFHGGTKVDGLAAIVALVARINQVFKTDMNIVFQLVDNNDAIIFEDEDSDPFYNDSFDVEVNQQVIDDTIGFDNYDIGHVVNTGGGGFALIRSVCSEFKAQGVTGSDVPVNDPFWIDYVAHEFGHQFGAFHTFSGLDGSCDEFTVSPISAYEVGSGSTIMSYAGICFTQNVTQFVHDNFHIRSIGEMADFLLNDIGSNCATILNDDNTAPVVDAGADIVIPANTPFTLTGSAQDEDITSLTYSWEQYDLANLDEPDNTKFGPLFRAFSPTSSSSRTFPQMSDILSGMSTFGERLPDVERDMTFRLTVRDGTGGIAQDLMRVTVAGGPGFTVTLPEAAELWSESQQTFQWEAANTALIPVSCPEVDILLSTDGGGTFGTIVAKNTANDGVETVYLPRLISQEARVMVRCSDNRFFAVNNGAFSLDIADKMPVFIMQSDLVTQEDTIFDVEQNDLTFEAPLSVDELTILSGDDYVVNDNRVAPNMNFNGVLNVNLVAIRGSAQSEPFMIEVIVTPVNDAPVANDDTLTITEDDSPILIDVVSNDQDVDGDTLTITDFNYSGGSEVAIEGNALLYTVTQGFIGQDEIIYTIEDGNGGVASATLRVTVNEVTSPAPIQGESGSSGGAWHFYTLWLILVMICLRRLTGLKRICTVKSYEL